jgi:hypothetical protein
MERVVVSTVAQADTANILRDLATKGGARSRLNYAAALESLYNRLACIPIAARRAPRMGGMSAPGSSGGMSLPVAMSPAAILSA